MVFQVGHEKLGGIKKGTKRPETLLKEERRAIFDAKISEKWERTIDELKPEYIADQFMGKPTERHEVVITKEPSKKVKDFLNGLIKR